MASTEPEHEHLEEEGEVHEDEDPGAQVAQIGRLEEVAVTTGEEDEDAVLDLKSKLYRFDKDGKQWKERGAGTVKLLKHKKTGKVRLVMRQSETLEICANHLISSRMTVQEHGGIEKSCLWHATDFSDGELKDELFCVRFASIENCKTFMEKFTEIAESQQVGKENTESDEENKNEIIVSKTEMKKMKKSIKRLSKAMKKLLEILLTKADISELKDDGKTKKRKELPTATNAGKPSLKKQKKIEMKKSLEDLTDTRKNLALLLKSLPKKKHIRDIFHKWQVKKDLRWTSKRDSWKEKRADTIPPQYTQKKSNCWAVSLFRQWYTLVKISGFSRPELTVDTIMEGVPLLHQDFDRRIRDVAFAADFMKNGGYVDDMLIHYKPVGNSEEERFEEFIEQLLSAGPVSVVVRSYPSYRSKNKSMGIVLSPTNIERHATSYEHFRHDDMLLTGHGVDSSGEEPIEYWECYQNYGDTTYGELGFIRFARHMGLILQAVEMKVNGDYPS